MDWQLSVMGPAITPVFWGLIRTPPEKRDQGAIDAGKEKTTAACKILDEQLGKTRFVAGDDFSYGDIPIGVMTRRYHSVLTAALPAPFGRIVMLSHLAEQLRPTDGRRIEIGGRERNHRVPSPGGHRCLSLRSQRLSEHRLEADPFAL